MKSKIRCISLLVCLFCFVPVVLTGCREKYQVKKEIRDRYHCIVTVIGPMDDFTVAFLTPSGECLKKTISKLDMSIGHISVDFNLALIHGSDTYLSLNGPTKTITWRLVVKRNSDLKTIYDKEITFIREKDSILIARVGEVGKAGL